jgi:hypothetical protein
MNDDDAIKKTLASISKIDSNSLVFFGTLFYPQIKISVSGQKSETKELEGDLFDALHPSNIVLDISFKKGRRVMVYKNGYVLVSFGSQHFFPFGYKKEERDKALEFLNLICAEAMFSPKLFAEAPSTLIFQAVRLNDMASLALDARTLQLLQGSLAALTSVRHIPLMTKSGQLIPGPVPEISVNTIEEIIRSAEETRSNDANRKERIILLLESWTHISNCEFAQSFTLSWLIIEKRINDLWDRLINSQLKIDYPGLEETDTTLNTKIKNRREKLENYNVYTTHIKIEVLKLLGVLTLEQYDQFMRFKDIRNGIVHPRKTQKVSYQNAYDLWYLIFSNLWGLNFARSRAENM